MKSKFIIFCFFVFFAIGCKKHEVSTTYIPEKLKEYMLGKKGNYWIYVNEKTGTIDSCYITQGPDFYYPHSGGSPDDPMLEECNTSYGGNLMLFSSMKTTNVQLELKTGIGDVVCLMPDVSKQSYINPVDNSVYKFLQFYDSIKINNNSYMTVVNTQYIRPNFTTNGHDSDTATFTCFIAEHIGILKFRMQYKLTDTTWSLIRYHGSK